LHHGAIEAFGGVIDVLQTGSSAAVPRWNAALDATNWWLSMAEQVASLERRSDGPTRSAVKRLSSKLLTLGYCPFSSTGEPTFAVRFNGLLERSWVHAADARRGRWVYDADLMVFEFTMRNGEQIVPTLPTSDCGSLSISL